MASRKDSSLVPESGFPAQSQEGSLEVFVMGSAFREKTLSRHFFNPGTSSPPQRQSAEDEAWLLSPWDSAGG
jgi:hypothetical protein